MMNESVMQHRPGKVPLRQFKACCTGKWKHNHIAYLHGTAERIHISQANAQAKHQAVRCTQGIEIDNREVGKSNSTTARGQKEQ